MSIRASDNCICAVVCVLCSVRHILHGTGPRRNPVRDAEKVAVGYADFIVDTKLTRVCKVKLSRYTTWWCLGV
jgi:hypothetical protein